jgi:hypothetical protein
MAGWRRAPTSANGHATALSRRTAANANQGALPPFDVCLWALRLDKLCSERRPAAVRSGISFQAAGWLGYCFSGLSVRQHLFAVSCSAARIGRRYTKKCRIICALLAVIT